MAFSRLVAQHKTLLTTLHENGLLSGFIFEWQLAMCPWCGSSMMYEAEVREYTWGWRCRKCGREAY